jgi:hypothetical protein
VRETFGLLVEVKYRSDMSGWPTPAEDPEVRSQLGREWMLLEGLEPRMFPGQPLRIDRRALAYVTVDAVLPARTFEAVARELASKGGDPGAFRSGTYWLSWFALADVAETVLAQPALSHESRVGLSRLLELLGARRLRAFSGVTAPSRSATIPWTYGARSYAVETPSAGSVPWTYGSPKEAPR